MTAMTGPGTPTTTAWSVHLEHVRRRWALVVLLAVVTGLATSAALLFAAPSWTGRAALAIVSQTRSPDQDAVLGRGYVDLFNQASLQTEYARRLGLAPDVTFSARLAVGTPILYVEAVAPDPDVAGHAATALATTLRDDVSNNVTGERVQAATDLTAQIRTARTRLAALSPTSPDRPGLVDQIGQLQNQLTTVQANSTNQLRDLQLDAGVTQNVPPMARTVALAVLGGALLGALAAVVIGALGPGLTTPTQVRARLGLDVLARLDGDDGHEDADRELARVLAHPGLPRPVRLAVTTAGSEDEAGRTWVARRLARLVARQGGTALFLPLDLGRGAADGVPGIADVLSRPGPPVLEDVVHRDGDGVLAAGPGSRPVDPSTALSRERTAALLERAQSLAEVVVVTGPGVADPGDAGSVVGGAADAVVVVLGPRTRATAARAAVAALGRDGGNVLGVVIVGDELPVGDTPGPTRPAEADGWVDAPTIGPIQAADPAREPAHALLQVRPTGPRTAP